MGEPPRVKLATSDAITTAAAATGVCAVRGGGIGGGVCFSESATGGVCFGEDGVVAAGGGGRTQDELVRAEAGGRGSLTGSSRRKFLRKLFSGCFQ